ncbi:MAG: ABC transporter substrate-binding protein [Verrucomicrobiota bacterium]
MFWFRALFFSAPVALILGGVLLFRQVGRLELDGGSDALVCVIREPIGPINPFYPLSGVTREVRDLVFEPLLIRDDDLNLRPNLIRDWDLRTVITIQCASEEAAGDSMAKLHSGEYIPDGIEVLSEDRKGRVLTVVLAGHVKEAPAQLIAAFEDENLANLRIVRLKLKHSIRDSLETFFESSVEKSGIRMLEYQGEQVADLFVEGETDLLLKELELYYESNQVLEPIIELKGIRNHTSFEESVLHLREDVSWHDGRPFTAADLLFSYALLTGPESPMPMAESFWFVEEIQPLNAVSVRVICRESPATMMESWEKLPVVPSHLLQGRKESDVWADYFEKPIGMGPFRVIRNRRDGGVVLERFDGFFRVPPRQQQIIYRRVDSLESKLLGLHSGRIDLVVPDERFQEWSRRNPGVMTQMRCLPRFQTLVAWNLTKPPFDKNQVRQALAKAVDHKTILGDTATRFQEVPTSLFFPGTPFLSKAMPLPLYDPRAAEREMEELGFLYDEEKGVRLDHDGQPLSFTLSVNEANSEQLQLARGLAEHWLALGIVVTIETLPWSELLNKRLAAREFDAVLFSWELPLGRDRFSSWHSDGIEKGGGNLWGLRNQVVDELVVKLREANDPTEIGFLAMELEKEIADLQPCFFVCDTGRILWLREGALEMVRPLAGDEMGSFPVGIGKSGLERSRPWWVTSAEAESEETNSVN